MIWYPYDDPDSWEECPECEGKGKVDNLLGDWVSCETCEGHGVVVRGVEFMEDHTSAAERRVHDYELWADGEGL